LEEWKGEGVILEVELGERRAPGEGEGGMIDGIFIIHVKCVEMFQAAESSDGECSSIALALTDAEKVEGGKGRESVYYRSEGGRVDGKSTSPLVELEMSKSAWERRRKEGKKAEYRRRATVEIEAFQAGEDGNKFGVGLDHLDQVIFMRVGGP